MKRPHHHMEGPLHFQPSFTQLVYQHPAELVLAISDQPIAGDLTVLKQEVVWVGGWQVIFAIIGESHTVTIRHDESCVFQEVLACAKLPYERCLHHHHFNKLVPHRYQHPRYTVDVNFDDAPHPVNPGYAELSLAFPAVNGQTPITRLQWAVSSQEIRWWTLHTYPDRTHVTCVHTTSTFNLISHGR